MQVSNLILLIPCLNLYFSRCEFLVNADELPQIKLEADIVQEQPTFSQVSLGSGLIDDMV